MGFGWRVGAGVNSRIWRRGGENQSVLNGIPVKSINADLSDDLDFTGALPLGENLRNRISRTCQGRPI